MACSAWLDGVIHEHVGVTAAPFITLLNAEEEVEMRKYAKNSPEAMARIVAAVLLADGSLDSSKIELLERKRVTEMIGISKAGFEGVLHEFCDDLLMYGQRSDNFERKLSLDVFALLLSEVTDKSMILRLTSVIIDLVSADGDICQHELSLVGYVMAKWGAEIAGLNQQPSTSVAR